MLVARWIPRDLHIIWMSDNFYSRSGSLFLELEDYYGFSSNRFYISKNNFNGADLSGIDISGLDLSGINLSDAILTNTNFRGTKLNDAILYNITSDPSGLIVNGVYADQEMSGNIFKSGYWEDLSAVKYVDAAPTNTLFKQVILELLHPQIFLVAWKKMFRTNTV